MTFDLPCKKSEVLFVVWRDAVSRRRTTDDDAVLAEQDLAVNCSVGWIRHENKKRILLAYEASDTGEIDHTEIPIDQIIAKVPIIRKRVAPKPSGGEPNGRQAVE